jgi:hypothetical protein
MFSAHVVKKKGTENEEAERIIKDLEKMGCKGKIVVKTDQEPSIVAVAKEIRRLRPEETILENSKVYDSQSNGIAERAVQSVECQVRTLLLALQKRLDVKVPVTHKIITWMVEHAADLLNKFLVGPDGRTAFERVPDDGALGARHHSWQEVCLRRAHRRHGGRQCLRHVFSKAYARVRELECGAGQ